jgi:hypothetical protein
MDSVTLNTSDELVQILILLNVRYKVEHKKCTFNRSDVTEKIINFNDCDIFARAINIGIYWSIGYFDVGNKLLFGLVRKSSINMVQCATQLLKIEDHDQISIIIESCRRPDDNPEILDYLLEHFKRSYIVYYTDATISVDNVNILKYLISRFNPIIDKEHVLRIKDHGSVKCLEYLIKTNEIRCYEVLIDGKFSAWWLSMVKVILKCCDEGYVDISGFKSKIVEGLGYLNVRINEYDHLLR